MAKYCFIRASAVRKLAKDYGKNCSAVFLEELDIFFHLLRKKKLSAFDLRLFNIFWWLWFHPEDYERIYGDEEKEWDPDDPDHERP
jgi:hypothetical protein